MSTPLSCWTRTCVALALTLAHACPVAAAPPAAQEAARARHDEGRRLFREDRFDPAAEVFKEAYALYPDPAYLFNIAVCYEHRGRWRLAVDYYDRFMAEAPDSSAAGDVARRRAAAVAARDAERALVVVATIPNGVEVVASAPGGEQRCVSPCRVSVDPGAITVSAGSGSARVAQAKSVDPSEEWRVSLALPTGRLVLNPPTSVGVLLDGKPVQAEVPLEVVAGTHVIRANGTERSVLVAPDGTTVVELESWADAPAPGARPQLVAGWTLVGVGGAGLASGIALAVLANKNFDRGRSIASGARTTDAEIELSELRSTVNAQTLWADVSFGLAAAAVTTGVVLLLLPDTQEVAAP